MNAILCPGLGGKAALIESGGVPFLLPLVKRDKVYEMKEFGKLAGLDSCLIIGAGAGPWPYAGTNCEVIKAPFAIMYKCKPFVQ